MDDADVENEEFSPFQIVALFKDTTPFEMAEEIQSALRSFDSSFEESTCTIASLDGAEDEKVLEINTQNDAFYLHCVDEPVPSDVLYDYFDTAYLADADKRDIAQHKSQVVIHHIGQDWDPFAQYLTTFAIGFVLSKFGATSILNTANGHFVYFPNFSKHFEEYIQETLFDTLIAIPTYVLFFRFFQNTDSNDKDYQVAWGADLLGFPVLALEMDEEKDLDLLDYMDALDAIYRRIIVKEMSQKPCLRSSECVFHLAFSGQSILPV